MANTTLLQQSLEMVSSQTRAYLSLCIVAGATQDII